MEFRDIDLNEILISLTHIVIAYVLTVPIGWDREAHSRGAGLRTFPLVGMGSCAYLLIGMQVLEGSEANSRLFYGLMTGIGFIGGGSIIKGAGDVSGTATAASIWNTGAIGAAVAWQRFELAIVLSVINFATLRLVRPLKRIVRDERTEIERERAAERVRAEGDGRDER